MRDVGDEFSARLACGIEKFLSRVVRAKMRFVFRREKSRLMMIEPPGQLVRSRVLKIDDRVFVAIEQVEIKQVSRAVQQAAVIDFRFRMDSFFVKARENGSRSDAV